MLAQLDIHSWSVVTRSNNPYYSDMMASFDSAGKACESISIRGLGRRRKMP